MRDYLQSLAILAAVEMPFERPSGSHWEEAERTFGFAFPEDFKRLLGTLGNGGFGGEADIAGELTLLNPASSSPAMVLTPENVLRWHECIHEDAAKLRFPLFPEPHGFVVVGSTGNRMHLLIESGVVDRPTYQVLWLDIDAEMAHRLDMTLCRFIYDLFHGLIGESWAEELRGLIWENHGPFYVSRPGLRTVR